ncbi:MAG: DUF2088 domain-containing protein [Anaerolineae bacterium]|nr:DUF2088 domain-containing protein [Anaerolineae bacterium]
MNANHIQLPWGKESLTADLPRGWRLGDVLEPVALPGAPNSLDEAQRALAEPVGMPRLRQLARSGIKIALVIDDDSRPTPVASLFPAVAAELQAGGASLQQATLVPALGVHRGMSADEVARRLGEDWLSKIAWHNPGGDDPEEMVFIGATSRGTPVWVDKTVAEADLIVSIGCIEPHIIASFGGGYKNLIPGVAGRATIAHNHALNCCPDTFNMVGQPIERNPMHLDLEEAGGMILGKVFIINAVLNSQLQVVRVVCGDPLQAHRAGTEISAGIYGVQVPKLADVVITDSNPMNSTCVRASRRLPTPSARCARAAP